MRERFTAGGAAFAVDANDLRLRVAAFAGNDCCDHAGMARNDGEFCLGPIGQIRRAHPFFETTHATLFAQPQAAPIAGPAMCAPCMTVPGAVGGTVEVAPVYGRRPRAPARSLAGVRVTRFQSGIDANLRKPWRSGRRSISEAMMAGSIRICSLLVVETSQSVGLRDLACVVCRISR